MKRQQPDGKKFAGPLTGGLVLAEDPNHNNSARQLLQPAAWWARWACLLRVGKELRLEALHMSRQDFTQQSNY